MTAQAQLIAALRKLGWRQVAYRGKHPIFEHAKTRMRITVPSTIGRGRGYANLISLAKRWGDPNYVQRAQLQPVRVRRPQ